LNLKPKAVVPKGDYQQRSVLTFNSGARGVVATVTGYAVFELNETPSLH